MIYSDTKSINNLVIDSNETYFSAAHYLPGHPKCGTLHGHTYFIRELKIRTTGFVDFSDIEAVIKSLDHALLIPQADIKEWKALKDFAQSNKTLQKIFSTIIPIPDNDLPGTTVENLARELYRRFMAITGVTACSFKLYEGPTQGAHVYNAIM